MRNAMEKYLFVSEVSSKLGLPKKYINDCCREHPERIPKFFILHGLIRFKESDVNEWIEQSGEKQIQQRS